MVLVMLQLHHVPCALKKHQILNAITASPVNVEAMSQTDSIVLRNAISQCASLPARLEAGVVLGSDELKTRPADIPVSNWGVKSTAAFDIIATSQLSLKLVSEVGVSAGVAAKAAESRKHEHNDTKCSELGWQCIPLASETYGAWGEEACNAFSYIAMRESILTIPSFRVSIW